MNVNVMGELALIFGISLVGEGVAALLQVVPLLVIVGLTTPVVYLATSWTVQLMLRLFRRKGEENHG